MDQSIQERCPRSYDLLVYSEKSNRERVWLKHDVLMHLFSGLGDRRAAFFKAGLPVGLIFF